MFSKFSSIFQNATAALSPGQPRHEVFKATWRKITHYFIDNKVQKVSIDQTNLPLYLVEMLVLLVEEEGEEGMATGPCMEFLLQHNVLETLITLARTDTPPGMKQKVLQFFTKLLSRIKQPLLPHVHVHKSIQKLIKICGEIAASPTELEETHFLLMLCAKLRADPYLTNFFIEGKKSGENGEKSLSFPLITSLLNLMQSPDARVGVKCCEGLLLCASVQEESCVDALLTASDMCSDLTKQLLNLYRALPALMDPIHVNSVNAKWGLDFSSQDDRLYFPGKRQLVAMLSWLDFLDQLIGSAHPEVGRALAEHIHREFLATKLQADIMQTCEDGAITATAHLAACVRTVSSRHLLHEFTLFTLGSCEEAEEADKHPHMLRHRLIQRCDHLSEEMCITTLKLFDTLLVKCDAEILDNLVLRNLKSRAYLLPDPPASPSSPPNTPESSKSKSDMSSSVNDTPDKQTQDPKSETESENSKRDSSERSLPDSESSPLSSPSSPEREPTEQKVEDSKEAVEKVDQSSGSTPEKTPAQAKTQGSVIIHNPGDSNVQNVDSNDANSAQSTSPSDNTENMNGQSANLSQDTEDIRTSSESQIKVDVLTEIDSLVEDYGAGALTGALSVDCGKEVNGVDADEFSPTTSIPDDDYVSPQQSPRHLPAIEQVVNSFLHIVPAEVKSSTNLGETDYSSYLNDAHRQVQETNHLCSGLNWPSDVAPAPAQEQQFYEGAFLHMLFGKLSRMLDQSYDVNLHVTCLCSRLAMLPHPHLHEFLLNPLLHTQPHTQTLYKLFLKLSRDVESRIKSTPDFQKKLLAVRKQLSGYYGDLSNIEDSNLLAGVIVLEEFCKEMAAVAFVKQHALVAAL